MKPQPILSITYNDKNVNDIPLKSVAIYIPMRVSQKPSPKHETINQKNSDPHDYTRKHIRPSRA